MLPQTSILKILSALTIGVALWAIPLLVYAQDQNVFTQVSLLNHSDDTVAVNSDQHVIASTPADASALPRVWTDMYKKIFVNEGDGAVQIPVHLYPAGTESVTVHYTTVDDTANAGGDFVGASGIITFAPGLEQSQTQYVTIIIPPDSIPEVQEAFEVQLSNPVNATIYESPSHIAIWDDDPFSTTVNLEAPTDPNQPLSIPIDTPYGQATIELTGVQASNDITLLISPTLIGNLPQFYTVLRPLYGLTTSGLTFDKAKITFPYQASDWVDAGILEASLRLLHFEDNEWQDITTGVDIKAKTITGETSGFSPFLIAMKQMGPCTISLNNGDLYTNKLGVSVFSNLGTYLGDNLNARTIILSNDGSFSGAKTQKYKSLLPWSLRNPGQHVATLLVYMREDTHNAFCGETMSDDIIYDPLPPEITQIAAEGRVLTASEPQNAQTLSLHIIAQDQENGSGVAAMQISTNADFAHASWQPFSESTQATLVAGKPLYVRVRDGAGNISISKSVNQTGGYQFFLPELHR